MRPIRRQLQNRKLRKTVNAFLLRMLILFAVFAGAYSLPVHASEEVTEALPGSEAEYNSRITTSDADLNTDAGTRRNLSEKRMLMTVSGGVLAVSVLFLVLQRRSEIVRQKREQNESVHRNGGFDE